MLNYKKKSHINLEKETLKIIIFTLEHPEEGRHGSDVECVSGDAHYVVLDSGQFAEQG